MVGRKSKFIIITWWMEKDLAIDIAKAAVIMKNISSASHVRWRGRSGICVTQGRGASG